MLNALKTRMGRALEVAVSLAPWVISMYVFYWLDSSGIWTSATPHRGKMSVAILAAGMLLSFLTASFFAGRRQKKAAGQAPGNSP